MQHLLDEKWIEIDVDAVKKNLESVNSLLDERVRLIAVVKADAYGHGAANIARILYQNGVDFFAVTFLNEAINLRRAGIRSSIMIFSPLIEQEQVKQAISNHFTLTVNSVYESQLIDEVSRHLKQAVTVHIKLDTGLGRFGLKAEELSEICQSLKDNPHIYIEGIYTHMAEAASSDASFTEKQFDLFMRTVNDLEENGFKIPVKHCANSAVYLKYSYMHLDAVRIGTLLSGQFPAGEFSQDLELVEPFTFKSRIISLKTLEAGSSLGYYRTYRLKEKAQIAVVPVGFNDGLALQVDNKATGMIDLLKIVLKKILGYWNVPRFGLYVTIKGRPCPIRGKVFMQMSMVEIPRDLEVKIGDEVELPVRKTLASKNLLRLYLKDGEAVKVESEDITAYMVDEEG